MKQGRGRQPREDVNGWRDVTLVIERRRRSKITIASVVTLIDNQGILEKDTVEREGREIRHYMGYCCRYVHYGVGNERNKVEHKSTVTFLGTHIHTLTTTRLSNERGYISID